MGTRKWLDSEVTVLPGVGESRRKLLTKLGLRTVGMSSTVFPHLQISPGLSPAQIREEGEYLISGELVDLTERPVSRRPPSSKASLCGDGSYARLTWFLVHRGRGFTCIYNRLQKAQRLWVFGHAKRALVEWEMNSPEFFLRPPQLGLTPVYPWYPA